MDLTQAKYVLAINDFRSLTKAAASVFISPSALNQQLAKIEKELGCTLFYHSHNEWTPTEAGEIYIEGARKAVTIQAETLEKINEVTHQTASKIKIGFTPDRGLRIFACVYPTFHELHPNITITPIEIAVKDQQEAISSGKLDFGFMMLTPSQRNNNTYLKIGSEDILAIVSKDHPLCALAANPGEPLNEISLLDLKNDPFLLINEESTLRKLSNELFKTAGFQPEILLEVTNGSVMPFLVSSMDCCALVPRYYIKKPNVTYGCFFLDNHPTWDLCISYQKNRYVSEPMKDLIKLFREYWNKVNLPL